MLSAWVEPTASYSLAPHRLHVFSVLSCERPSHWLLFTSFCKRKCLLQTLALIHVTKEDVIQFVLHNPFAMVAMDIHANLHGILNHISTTIQHLYIERV